MSNMLLRRRELRKVLITIRAVFLCITLKYATKIVLESQIVEFGTCKRISFSFHAFFVVDPSQIGRWLSELDLETRKSEQQTVLAIKLTK